MKWLGGLLALLALVAVAGCGEPDEDRIPGPRLLEEGDFEIVEMVELGDDGFSTERVEIEAGEVVSIELTGTEPDRVRGYVDDEIESDTGELLPGETTRVRLTNPGEVTYESDSGATLVIVVLEPAPA